jgi:antitoxin MazE
MKIAKWGNSLAVRIPKELAEELNLAVGTEVTIRGGRRNTLVLDVEESAAQKRAAAIERIREMRVPVPEGFKFDRDEANERGGPYE